MKLRVTLVAKQSFTHAGRPVSVGETVTTTISEATQYIKQHLAVPVQRRIVKDAQ